ncbi:MAG: YopX family protein [Prevotella sp.]|nr:YopX family protein [Prevotella sp.]
MKRTIKFRGKRLDNGEWVYGDLLHPHTSCRIVSYDESETDMGLLTDYHYYDVIPETVGQFTGFVDMAGQDVYEGDYMLCKGVLPSNKDEIYCQPLVYHKDALCYLIAETGTYMRLVERDVDGNMMYTVVVGNIHDNPELQSGYTEDVKMLIKQIYGKYSRKCLFMSKEERKKEWYENSTKGNYKKQLTK